MSDPGPVVNKCECGWVESWNDVNARRKECPRCGAKYRETERVRRFYD